MKILLEFEPSEQYLEGLKQTQFFTVSEENQSRAIKDWVVDLIKNACYPYTGNWITIKEVKWSNP